MWIKVKNITIFLRKHGIVTEALVHDSPYYKALHLNDEKIVKEYVESDPLNDPKRNNWTHLRNIVRSIQSGYTVPKASNRPIKLDFKCKQWICLDGHHRLAVLLFLHGENVMVYVDSKGRVLRIQK